MALAPAAARPRPDAPAEPEPPAARQGSPRAPAVAGLAALIAIAAALRIEGIGTWYWLDEALSIGLARHDLVDIPRLLLRDGSPPLWYLLLHGWTAVFGTGVAATHALSVVFAVFAVPLAWLISGRLFGRRVAWVAAVLATMSPFITYFSRETRMYSLVAVLSIAVAGSFIAAFVDLRPRAVWVFAASAVALLYTHNWGIYTFGACAIALVPVWVASHDRRALTRRASLAFGVVAVAYLPWVPALLSQVKNTGAPWSYTPSARGVLREIAALWRDERVLAALVPVAAAGLAPLARRWRSRDAIAAISLTVIGAVPIATGWVLAHVEPSWATRYLAVVVGPLILVLAIGLARAGAIGIAALAVAGLLILQPVTRVNGLPMPRDAKSNGHGLAHQMAPRLVPGDLVLAAQPEAVPLLALELGDDFDYGDPTGIVEDPTFMDWRDAEDRLRAASFDTDLAPLVDALRPGDRVLLVLPGKEPRETDTSWIRLFRSRGRQIEAALRADDRFGVVDRLAGSDEEYVTLDAVLFERLSR